MSKWVAETNARGAAGSPGLGMVRGPPQEPAAHRLPPSFERGALSCLLLEGSPTPSAPLHFGVVTPARNPWLQALPTRGAHLHAGPVLGPPLGAPLPRLAARSQVDIRPLSSAGSVCLWPCRVGVGRAPLVFSCGHVALQGFVFLGSLSAPWQEGPQGAIPGGEALWDHAWVTLSTLGKVVSYASREA